MTRRSRTLLKAASGLVLLAVLGTIVYYGVYRKVQQEKIHEVETRFLLRFDKPNVSRLVVENYTDPRVVLERAGDDPLGLPNWQLSEPIRGAADNLSVNSLLGVLELIESQRVLLESEIRMLSTYGLDPPREKLVIVTQDGVESGLLIGNRNGLDNLLYVQRIGEKDLWLVRGDLEESLIRNHFDLRRKTLVDFSKDQVKKFLLKENGQTVGLLRNEKSWNLYAPFEDLADPTEIERLLNTLVTTQAVSFPAGESGSSFATGLESPTILMEVYTADNQNPLRIVFGQGMGGANQGKFYAQGRQPVGPVMEIRAFQFHNLRKTAFELQAKSPLRFDPQEVFKIKLASESELIVAEKKQEYQEAVEGNRTLGKENWQLISPRPVKANPRAMASLLNLLQNLKAQRFVGNADQKELSLYGLEKPQYTIMIYDREGKELGWLKIAKSSAELVYVQGSSRPRICQLKAAFLDWLSQPNLADKLSQST